MEENSDQTSQESPEKPEFHLKNEDFPTLQSTTRSRKSKKKSANIANKPSKIVDEPSGVTSEPNGITNEPGRIMKRSGGIINKPNAVMNEPTRIMRKPSGIMNEPSVVANEPARIMKRQSGVTSGQSQIMNRPTGIIMPTAGTSSMQVYNTNVGFIPRRPGPYFLEYFQPIPRMNVPIYPDGTAKNIPSSTLMTDQYGMLGFLSAYRGMQIHPALATLAIGEDPANMGLGMNNRLVVRNPSGYGRREIHVNYGGPWAEMPDYSAHAETKIPNEYRTNLLLGDKLAQLKFSMLEEDTLFYIFYNYPGEQYQIAAAYELYMREWRYHKMDRLWLRRFDHKSVVEYTTTYERGLYNVFDRSRWRKLTVRTTLLYKDLEGKPILPPDMRKYFDP
ncbi:unnamed protein product [Cercopithifilaria johnstoni]|uniref:NOT2/NOT3/NOT5 C-terminal domain-containing protein n=1 Tax=Cercopithifilaria johnstoni TaxID=2874296 RepID=A0A8J2M3M8_9BILA|nr:unnamed protein product [Cercopithifilaria johnstoni]